MHLYSELLRPKCKLFRVTVPPVRPKTAWITSTVEMRGLKVHPTVKLQLPSTEGELTVLAFCFIEAAQSKHCTPAATWWLRYTPLTTLEAQPMPLLICVTKNLGRSSSLKPRSLMFFLRALF
jgi:hypothetical protein